MSAGVWAILAFLIFANALYVAAEFGAVGAMRSRVRRLADSGNRLARRLVPYVENPQALDRYVGTSQIGITLASLGLGAYAQASVTPAFAAVLESSFDVKAAAAASAASIVVLVILTAVQLLVGELVPKALALQYPTQTALMTVLPMRWSLAVFRPLITLLNSAALVLLRPFGAGEQRHRHLHSPEELDLLITESRDGGLLEPEEQQRLARALRLSMRSARDLMVPIDRLTMLDVGTPWDDVLRVVGASTYSRIPLYRESRDQIVGVLHVRDLVDRFAAEGAVPLARLMRPLARLAADTPADRVLSDLRERRSHVGLVIGASQAPVGLITMQDVLGGLLGSGAASVTGSPS